MKSAGATRVVETLTYCCRSMTIKRALLSVSVFIMVVAISSAERTRVGLTVVVPENKKTTQDLIKPGFSDCRRAAYSHSRPLRSKDVSISLTSQFLQTSRTRSAMEILDFYCSSIFGRGVNTIMTLNVNDRDKSFVRTVEYIESVAQEFGYPVISWNPSYDRAMEVRKV